MGNDWLKSGDYTPSRKLQENVSWFELECMPLSEFLQLADLVTRIAWNLYNERFSKKISKII